MEMTGASAPYAAESHLGAWISGIIRITVGAAVRNANPARDVGKARLQAVSAEAEAAAAEVAAGITPEARDAIEAAETELAGTRAESEKAEADYSKAKSEAEELESKDITPEAREVKAERLQGMTSEDLQDMIENKRFIMDVTAGITLSPADANAELLRREAEARAAEVVSAEAKVAEIRAAAETAPVVSAQAAAEALRAARDAARTADAEAQRLEVPHEPVHPDQRLHLSSAQAQ